MENIIYDFSNISSRIIRIRSIDLLANCIQDYGIRHRLGFGTNILIAPHTHTAFFHHYPIGDICSCVKPATGTTSQPMNLLGREVRCGFSKMQQPSRGITDNETPNGCFPRCDNRRTLLFRVQQHPTRAVSCYRSLLSGTGKSDISQ